MNQHVKTVLTTLRRWFESYYGDRLDRLILFGSHARGDANPGSDIDVLVVLKGPVNSIDEINKTNHAIADLSLKYDVVISCVFIDQETFNHRFGPFLRNVRREGVAL